MSITGTFDILSGLKVRDRAGRAARREVRLKNQANVDVDIGRDVDDGDSVSGSWAVDFDSA